MNDEHGKRKALEAAGWKVSDAADFLDMNDEERQLLDARVELHWRFAGRRDTSFILKRAGAQVKDEPASRRQDRTGCRGCIAGQLVRAFTAAGGRIVVKSRGESEEE